MNSQQEDQFIIPQNLSRAVSIQSQSNQSKLLQSLKIQNNQLTCQKTYLLQLNKLFKQQILKLTSKIQQYLKRLVETQKQSQILQNQISQLRNLIKVMFQTKNVNLDKQYKLFILSQITKLQNKNDQLNKQLKLKQIQILKLYSQKQHSQKTPVNQKICDEKKQQIIKKQMQESQISYKSNTSSFEIDTIKNKINLLQNSNVSQSINQSISLQDIFRKIVKKHKNTERSLKKLGNKIINSLIKIIRQEHNYTLQYEYADKKILQGQLQDAKNEIKNLSRKLNNNMQQKKKEGLINKNDELNSLNMELIQKQKELNRLRKQLEYKSKEMINDKDQILRIKKDGEDRQIMIQKLKQQLQILKGQQEKQSKVSINDVFEKYILKIKEKHEGQNEEYLIEIIKKTTDKLIKKIVKNIYK